MRIVFSVLIDPRRGGGQGFAEPISKNNSGYHAPPGLLRIGGHMDVRYGRRFTLFVVLSIPKGAKI